jgi:hypothetical protein
VRTFYFDIDGTVLKGSFGAPKQHLADGALERAVRAAGVERLVCVGNVVSIARSLERMQPGHDSLGLVLRVCQGVWADQEWFRQVTTLVADSHERVAHIDTSLDWWWADDLALEHSQSVEREDLFQAHHGGRILVPTADGDGQDVLDWLAAIPAV